MANLNEKKNKLMEKQAQSRKNKKIIISSLLGAIVLGIVAFVLLNQEALPGLDDKYSFGQKVDYSGKQIQMTEVPSTIADGKIRLALSDIQTNSIVYSSYETTYDVGDGQNRLPVLAYITPAGRLISAIGFCEPCFSRSFHINGEDLVCNSCGTRWTLADLKGISGGCLDYPPEELPYTVDETTQQVVIDENLLKNWSPRKF